MTDVPMPCENANDTINIVCNIVECESVPLDIPKFIFIIPYRNRQLHLEQYLGHMKYVLGDIPKSHYKILVVHQADTRVFNRGGVKNIGFLYVKQMYPADYKTITLVFNDVDTFPLKKNYLDYTTQTGTVKHFFGFKYALGGIVSITCGDFEKINGYPNLWTWGYEDNLLQIRLNKAGILIDRSNFYDLDEDYKDCSIYVMNNHGYHRVLNQNEYIRVAKNTPEGATYIRNIRYDITENKIPSPIIINGINEPVGYNSITHGLIKNTIHDVHMPRDIQPYNALDAVDFTVLNVYHFNTMVPSPTNNKLVNMTKTNTPFKSLLSNRNPIMYMQF